MITTFVRRQLYVFALLAVLSVSWVALQYSDVKSAAGIGHYKISAQFADISGLYPRALVTYRGVDVGKVTSVEVTANGARVNMDINNGVRVPKDATLKINSTSAIGEQFVDFVSDAKAGPYLASGAVVPEAQTVQLEQIGPVLDNLDTLLKSVPQDATARVLDELDTSLGGSADDLRAIIDQTSRLVAAARDDVGPTTDLIRNLVPVLKTQRDLGATTTAYVASLASLSSQLKASDGDIRSLIATTPGATGVTNTLINRLRPNLPSLLRDGTTIASVLNVYSPNLRTLLIQYPALVARLESALFPHADQGIVKLDLKANLNDPSSCLKGYIPVDSRRSPGDTSALDTPANLHCEAPSDAPQSYRGARNAPCPNDPNLRSATPEGCGLSFGSEGQALQSVKGGTTADNSAPPATGMLELMGGSATANGGTAWQDLLTGPLDR